MKGINFLIKFPSLCNRHSPLLLYCPWICWRKTVSCQIIVALTDWACWEMGIKFPEVRVFLPSNWNVINYTDCKPLLRIVEFQSLTLTQWSVQLTSALWLCCNDLFWHLLMPNTINKRLLSSRTIPNWYTWRNPQLKKKTRVRGCGIHS